MSLILLFDHVLNNNITAVKNFLDNHSSKKKAKSLCIVYAAALGQAEMVKVMIESGISINTSDVFTKFKRRWESSKLKKLQATIGADMKQFTRGWAPILTPSCVAAFYGHKRVLGVIFQTGDWKYTLNYNPYQLAGRDYIGPSKIPCWNAVTCALFGRQWEIANVFVELGLVTTDMEEQYPRFLEFRTVVRIPEDVINIVFSFL
tara:strand:+ start:257 stop:868 length:612 start_codon:yes stop_codon:yes gene_type:complete